MDISGKVALVTGGASGLGLASVKALVPVVICGLPLFLVIVFFPAILEILRTFSDIAWVNP